MRYVTNFLTQQIFLISGIDVVHLGTIDEPVAADLFEKEIKSNISNGSRKKRQHRQENITKKWSI